MACDKIVVLACCRICERLRLAVSCAKSASMMRLREAVRFSLVVARLSMVELKRFWMAPRLARLELIWLSAASMAVSAVLAPAAVEMSMTEIAVPVLAMDCEPVVKPPATAR